MTDIVSDQEALLRIVAGLVPATAQEIGAALGRLSMDLQRLSDRLAEADEVATRLADKYQLEFDKAFLLSGVGKTKMPTEAVRNAEARMATAPLRLELEVAKLDVRSLKAAHRTLDRRIDVGRTQAATVRSEHRTLSYGQAS